jgi:endogenous inhibitor of DNA gyrase (YacG/DUF329 family)
MKIRCPLCKKVADSEANPYRPFCSKRCKFADLGAWLAEEYRVPGQPEPLSEEISRESGQEDFS